MDWNLLRGTSLGKMRGNRLCTLGREFSRNFWQWAHCLNARACAQELNETRGTHAPICGSNRTMGPAVAGFVALGFVDCVGGKKLLRARSVVMVLELEDKS